MERILLVWFFISVCYRIRWNNYDSPLILTKQKIPQGCIYYRNDYFHIDNFIFCGYIFAYSLRDYSFYNYIDKRLDLNGLCLKYNEKP